MKMERSNVERVTSLYADTYFNDDFCEYNLPENEITETNEAHLDTFSSKDDWKSPSDLLIGIVDLIPPFTSKITRGITHEGILAIGNSVLEGERERFLRYMKRLIRDNDVAWGHILEHEKIMVSLKVKEIYEKILVSKTKTLMTEINSFYESTLQELEDHLRKEVTGVLTSAHANIISDLNTEIKEKLEYEKKSLEKVLKERYTSEVKKIKHYYHLLLENECNRNDKLINKAFHDRNDAIKAFIRQIEAETTTSTMYVMCTERKKCRIKQFIIDNYHSLDIAEKVKKIKERQEILDAYKGKEKRISEINKEWQEKIKKILQLFLKFVSFSLKLLPEQTMFLLDLEKMVVLQLNEMQKSPTQKTSILVDEDEFNYFQFQEAKQADSVCDKDPFVIIGDTSDSIPTSHGSRETLGPDVDLPMTRLQRQFIYAKCDRFNEVKTLLETQRCKCRDMKKPPSPQVSDESILESVKKSPTLESKSSEETLIMDDIQILRDCPVRRCNFLTQKYSFPDLNNYLDFTEENYSRVKAILGNITKNKTVPESINLRDIIWQELPFATTHEKYHHVGTQCSSQEDLTPTILPCPCVDEAVPKLNEPSKVKESLSKQMDYIMMKRRASLRRVIHSNPNLLKMFTDESFDFVYTNL